MPVRSHNQSAMELRRLSLFVFFSFLSLGLSAQFVISGQILDSATREPLTKASVFCQNTTLGTLTGKDGSFSLTLKSGGYDLIFSYTGYHTQTIRVNEQQQLEVLLSKKENNMEEVVLRSSFEVADGWEKYGDFFLKQFIGSTPNARQCELLNPDVLKFYFYKRTNRLKVMATDALLVNNQALGYQLRYQLDSFVYHYNSSLSSYRGYCLFMEMEGGDSLQVGWEDARREAYKGSRLHFMHSYYDSTLSQEGWIVSLLDSADNKKFNALPDPYDTLYYLGKDDSTRLIEIWFPRKISVTYKGRSPEPEYLKAMNLPKSVPYPVSYVELRDAVAIRENGYFFEQADWINQGYWSWKNLADLLPYDYVPEE